jgi:hypothetical protein
MFLKLTEVMVSSIGRPGSMKVEFLPSFLEKWKLIWRTEESHFPVVLYEPLNWAKYADFAVY